MHAVTRSSHGSIPLCSPSLLGRAISLCSARARPCVTRPAAPTTRRDRRGSLRPHLCKQARAAAAANRPCSFPCCEPVPCAFAFLARPRHTNSSRYLGGRQGKAGELLPFNNGGGRGRPQPGRRNRVEAALGPHVSMRGVEAGALVTAGVRIRGSHAPDSSSTCCAPAFSGDCHVVAWALFSS